jgi:hypothetical protein
MSVPGIALDHLHGHYPVAAPALSQATAIAMVNQNPGAVGDLRGPSILRC